MIDIKNLIIAGDYNICHKAIDIHDPIRNKNVSGFLPVEAFELEETTASDEEYQPDEKDNADDDEILTVENTRKRKIQNDHKTTSPPKLARKQKETPIGKL